MRVDLVKYLDSCASKRLLLGEWDCRVFVEGWLRINGRRPKRVRYETPMGAMWQIKVVYKALNLEDAVDKVLSRRLGAPREGDIVVCEGWPPGFDFALGIASDSPGKGWFLNPPGGTCLLEHRKAPVWAVGKD